MVTKFDSLLTDLQKTFGTDSAMRASEIPRNPPISSGSLALDYAMGFGGFPSDRLIEICGKPGTGKTTLALTTMLNALKKFPDRGALFMDLEHKLDKDWLELIVGKELLNDRVIYLQPPTIERATNMYRQAVESGHVCCAILDSIGGAPTIRRNDDAEVGHYGGNAIGVGEFARTAGTYSAVYQCLTIGVNQTRADMSGYNRLITPGGQAWAFHCVSRVELVRGKDNLTINMPGEPKPVPIGYTIYAKVRKNGLGPEGRVAYYWFYNVWTEANGFGIDQLDEIGRLAIMTKVVEMKGGWYAHPALPGGKVQGLLKLQNAIKADEKLRETIVSEVMASLKEVGGEVAPLSDPDAPVEEGVVATPIQDLWASGAQA